jgi:hypothetical protein
MIVILNGFLFLQIRKNGKMEKWKWIGSSGDLVWASTYWGKCFIF